LVDQNHSEKIGKYFSFIEEELEKAYSIASKCRKLGLDPEDSVDVPLTRTLPERVESLVASVIPQLKGSGVANRISELERKHGAQAWDVALMIALEVVQEKFCKFNNKKEAMEAGIRTGFAYATMGIVSAPLEGFIELKIKKRKDGKEYLAMIYAGPVRGAGGTAAAVSLLIADYVRIQLGYGKYDADESEIARVYVELVDYHERVTNLQYKPSADEIKFLVKSLPVEIDGDPTEEIEVSNYKDLPRIETNRIRGGMCLVMSMVALKAPKLWKAVSKFPKELGLDWNFLPEFISLQKKSKSLSSPSKESTKKILPDYTYIADLVAGRPVLSYPQRSGGFRLRYGRSRVSGYSATSLHPNTLLILDRYIATGTQLKTERPGKAAAITPCETIEPPIIKLNDGSVLRFDKDDKEVISQVEEILYLGDMLVSYGDFFDRAHPLVPAGYCEEWYIQELELACHKKCNSIEPEILSQESNVPKEVFDKIFKNPLTFYPSAKDAIKISKFFDIALHPRHTPYFSQISSKEIEDMMTWFQYAKLYYENGELSSIVLPNNSSKRSLELLGIAHKLIADEHVVIENDEAKVIFVVFRLAEEIATIPAEDNPVSFINKVSPIKIRDKAGTFIGARMGRPEKSKMRKLKGSPQTLFPVGEEGGRLRSFQAALESGKVTSSFPIFFCHICNEESIYRICITCGSKCAQRYHCRYCGNLEKPSCQHGRADTFSQKEIPIKKYFDAAVAKTNAGAYPDIIKGVRGTSNKDHMIENLAKGILRSKYDLYVNKDGTIRYDMSELPITHFTPLEIGTSVGKLNLLGYSKDIYGKPLEKETQVVEIFPQDVILPNGEEMTDESAGSVLIRVCQFVDDLLINFYDDKPYYNVKTQEDLIGKLVIGLAPHISAGIVGRIIGFSKTHAFFAHPLYHAAMRRDADGDEACVLMLMEALLNFSRQFLPDARGSRTMDAPLVLSATILPSEVDDMAHRVDVAWRYPLLLYEAALQYKQPWEVNVEMLGNRLNTYLQYEGLGYTHPTLSINSGVNLSAYKTLETMEDKLKGQMRLAEKIRAVDAPLVAQMVIEKHFLKDIKGNLRRFSSQNFRCIKCNEIFRRPPLRGKCSVCAGKLVFTVSEMSIIKYLEPALSLAKLYSVDNYVQQTLEITKVRYLEVFGKDTEKQEGLGRWFG